MTEILLVLLICFIVVGICGLILYAIYLPFRNRLLKSGKLNKKQSQQINKAFIISLSLIVIVLIYNRNYRTSSETRVENIIEIDFPDNFKVIKDEYQDIMQDYCIIYEVQFDKKSTSDFIEKIKTSKYFKARVSQKANWFKSNIGYGFNKQVGDTNYYIELDTVTNVFKYNECSQ